MSPVHDLDPSRPDDVARRPELARADVGPARPDRRARRGQLRERRGAHRPELAAERHGGADEVLDRRGLVDVDTGEGADHQRVRLCVPIAGVDGERAASRHHVGRLAEAPRRVGVAAPRPQQQRLRAQVALVFGEPLRLPVPPPELRSPLDREDVGEVVRHDLAPEPIARPR